MHAGMDGNEPWFRLDLGYPKKIIYYRLISKIGGIEIQQFELLGLG